jgi:hypothetical protein
MVCIDRWSAALDLMQKHAVERFRSTAVPAEHTEFLAWFLTLIIFVEKSKCFAALYRNPFSEVSRMLSKYHAGHYKVYNLCCEKAYDPSRFIDGEFVAFPFDDHEVPALPMLFDFVWCAS